MAFDINTFRSELQFGGSRPSLFEVSLTNPVDTSGDQKFTFTCKIAQIPSAVLTPIEVPYMGRRIKVAGSRNFEELNCTIINDEDFKVRNALETWSNAINTFEGNIRNLPDSSPASYKSTANVIQYSQTGALLRTYSFIGVWPQQLSGMDLAWENEAQIGEFSCSFAYDYYYIDKSSTGNAGGK